MFERYTEKAKRAVFFGRYEAAQFGSPQIESEHLLLGLLRENKSLAHHFLNAHDNIELTRKEIARKAVIREKIPTSVAVPLSDECNRILAYAAEEAATLSHDFVGTGHLLLGVLRERDCFAARLLAEKGINLPQARELIADYPREASWWERVLHRERHENKSQLT